MKRPLKLYNDVLVKLQQQSVIAPSQLDLERTRALSVLHNMKQQGYIKQIRKGTQGQPSKLLTYVEPLFALNT